MKKIAERERDRLTEWPKDKKNSKRERVWERVRERERRRMTNREKVKENDWKMIATWKRDGKWGREKRILRKNEREREREEK